MGVIHYGRKDFNHSKRPFTSLNRKCNKPSSWTAVVASLKFINYNAVTYKNNNTADKYKELKS